MYVWGQGGGVARGGGGVVPCFVWASSLVTGTVGVGAGMAAHVGCALRVAHFFNCNCQLSTVRCLCKHLGALALAWWWWREPCRAFTHALVWPLQISDLSHARTYTHTHRHRATYTHSRRRPPSPYSSSCSYPIRLFNLLKKNNAVKSPLSLCIYNTYILHIYSIYKPSVKSSL